LLRGIPEGYIMQCLCPREIFHSKESLSPSVPPFPFFLFFFGDCGGIVHVQLISILSACCYLLNTLLQYWHTSTNLSEVGSGCGGSVSLLCVHGVMILMTKARNFHLVITNVELAWYML